MNGSDVILLTKEGPIATVVLNRPSVLNAASKELTTKLAQALEEIREDDEIRVVVMSGAGESFCSGQDMKERDSDPSSLMRWTKTMNRAEQALREMDKVSIAKVDGYCLGFGFILALNCDLIVCTDRAKFGFPEIDIGYVAPLVPPLAWINYTRAKLLAFTGKKISGGEAQSWGIATVCVSPEKLGRAVDELVQTLVKKDRKTLMETKRLFSGLALLREHTSEASFMFDLSTGGAPTATDLYDRAIDQFTSKSKGVKNEGATQDASGS